jgi:hypothetical protein
MFDIFKTILDVAKSLLGLSDQLRSADRQRREAMSGLFSSISDCLVDVSTEIRAGRIPHGRCAEIEQYAQDLPGKIRNEVPDRADELGQLLQSAYHVEIVAMNLHQLEQDADKEPYLAQIEEAAGKFRALANLIKAG